MNARITYRTGHMFGNIEYLGDVASKPGQRRMVEGRCACGNVSVFRLDHLRSGHTTNCNDCRRSNARTRLRAQATKGGDTHSRNQAYAKTKASAKGRGIPFSLTKAEFFAVATQPCYYCGVEHSHEFLARGAVGDPFKHNGVDRVDSSKGYTADNCVPCCRQCNVAKLDHTIENFIGWLDRIHTHSQNWRKQYGSSFPP